MHISIISLQTLQKIFATVAVLAMVFSPLAHVQLAHAAPTTLFTDGFETTPAFPNWTSADGKWQNDSNGPHTGSRLANVNGPSNVGGEILRKATTTAGYEDIEVGFWYRFDGLDAGDSVYAEWTADGSTWNIMAQFNGADGTADDVSAWTQSTAILPPAAENTANFAIRFRSDVNVGNDNFFLDDVTITALPIPPPSATLTLTKVVSGGTAVPSDFTLLATGPTTVSGASGSLNVTGFTVTPGTYTLSETGGPTGYTAGTYSCVVNDGPAVVSNTLTLVNGDVATCTVTNTFTETPKQCLITSDITTLGNGAPSVSTFVHPAWTVGLATTGAQWIWSSDGAQTATFTKAFSVDNAPTGSVLRMAVDNSYTAKLNGTPLTCDGSGIENFGNPVDTCSAPVVAGINTLEVVAQNFGGPNSADLINPAGFVYELVVYGSSCSPIVEETYVIDGYKFDDVNADGVWDDAEGVVSGWTISVQNEATLVVTSTTTKADGSYRFVVPEGDYIITEEEVPGWVQTAVVGDGAAEDGACYMSFGGTSEVLAGSCDFGNHQEQVAQCLLKDGNLIQNGSFETPVVTDNSGQWHLFASVPNWTSTTGIIELWRNLMGPASDGLQNAELDDNAPTTLSQGVATVAGNVYMVMFDFAARPGTASSNNELQVSADGDVLDTLTLDGTGDLDKDWVTYSYEFTAADASTDIAFEDLGDADGLGTLLDNVSVCLTQDNSEPVFASLTIDKVVVGEGASDEQAFTFDTWLTDNTSLSGAGTPVTFSELPAGAYSFSEINLPARWALESVSCRDEEGIELDQDETLAGVTINLSEGENVTCTVTNRYTPKDSNSNEENIVVKKVVTEGSDTNVVFGFDASWLDVTGPFDFTLSHGQMWDSGNLLADEYYSVSEYKKVGGWSLTKSSTCTSTQEYEVNVFDDMLLHDGETITCTFVNDQDRYILEGFVWEDTNEDGVFDADESPLADWKVSATDGTTTVATTSNSVGKYRLNVPEGTWTITEVVENGWNATHPLPTKYVVTVPIPSEEESVFEEILSALFPTAYAAVVDTLSGFNFGNKQESSGSSSGSRRNRDNNGGGNSSGPVPQVLGAASSTIPVGAPNTGNGGSAAFAPVVTVAVLPRRQMYVG